MADVSSAAASIVASVRNLDIRKVAAVIITLAAIAHTVSVGELKLDGMIPASWIPHVIAYANAFVIVAPFLVAGHSFTALKWPDVTPPKALIALLAIGGIAAALAFSATTARAAERMQPMFGESRTTAAPAAAPSTPAPLICDPLKLLPGCSVQGSNGTVSLETVWNNIQAAALADLQYANAMATQVGTPGSKLRAACYTALINAKQQQQNVVGSDGKPMTQPDPHVITDLEKVSELIDGLQATSPIMAACVPAANAIGQNALTFVNAVVTGTVLKAATGL